MVRGQAHSKDICERVVVCSYLRQLKGRHTENYLGVAPRTQRAICKRFKRTGRAQAAGRGVRLSAQATLQPADRLVVIEQVEKHGTWYLL